MSRKQISLGLASIALLSQPLGTSAQQGNPFSSTPPGDVSIPIGFPGNPIDFFDEFSWQLFISMVWPADPANPGAPAAGPIGTQSGPLVFETYKSNADTFQPAGVDPGNFDAVAGVNPCGAQAAQRDALVIAAFSKFEELHQAGFGDLVGPIIAQNRRYVRYITGYNRTAYNHIVSNKLYLRSSPPKEFPNGAIVTKSAWIEMRDVAHPERYHRRKAWIVDPATGACLEEEMGLVGLHIVQKTASRPQWTWSSFEQIDNVPETAPATATFHDGSTTPMPARNPYSQATAQVPFPFNITRITPIHPATLATNVRLKAKLAHQNLVWQFYKLVMTQWPLAVASPQIDGRPMNTFPGTGATSAFANTTMETFDQKRITTGCMACHDLTRVQTDFVWSVNTHSFPIAQAATFAASAEKQKRDPSVRRLKRLMEEATRRPNR